MKTALVLLLATAAPPNGATVTPFKTEVAPRLDPVFGDIATLRKAVDEFLSLHGEMESVRSDFSSAVHTTLGDLTPPGGAPAKRCPPAAATHYGQALAAGGRYLSLGRRMEGRYREIRRSETLGDSIGLTPDYRWKIKKAQGLYMDLVRDYREMRVAFYDQLAAEMRFAGCDLAAPAVATKTDGASPDDADVAPSNPTDPAAWELEAVTEAAAREKAELAQTGRGGKKAAAAAPEAGPNSPAIWIEIDNTQCSQPGRLFIDGASQGTIAARRKVSVRTRSGPHQLCMLPDSDKRACGAQGTVRKAYLYEGWTLSVRCDAAGKTLSTAPRAK